MASVRAKPLLETAPLQINPPIFGAVLRNRGPIRFDLSAGYYLSKNGKALLIVVKPIKPNQDLAFSKSLVAAVHEAIAAASDDFRREFGGEQADGGAAADGAASAEGAEAHAGQAGDSPGSGATDDAAGPRARKSTRLNSSH